MKLLAEVKAGKTIIKESYKVTNKLNCIQFHNYYHTMKMKSWLSRLIDVGFRFCRNSDMSIINSITYEIYKCLISQVSMKMPSFYECL